jgi:3-oxoacyl-[acyl-carrier protein] reductase
LLDGSTALVTGAGSGLGAAIARVLAGHGASVVVAARRPEAGAATVQAITAAGGAARFVACDVTQRAQVDEAVRVAVDAFGGLDIVVHNANSSRAGVPSQVEDIAPEDWDDVIRVALLGAFNCARAAHQVLRRREGRFIVLSSAAGMDGSTTLPAYAAAKGAQRAFVKSLAHEWGTSGITVNAVAPVAETEAMRGYLRADPEARRRLTTRAALGRLGDPERDVAQAVVFLASGLARFVTGQTLVVDGGAFMGL